VTVKREYRVETTAWWLNNRINVPSCTVIEREAVQQFSGLLDQHGNKLMVTLKSEPAGFIVFPD
jgi:hypothetical protein